MSIDTHAHLEMKEFDRDRDQVVQRSRNLGIEKIITVGVDLESSRRAVALSERYDCVYAAVGIHPGEIEKYSNPKTDCHYESIHDDGPPTNDMDELAKLAKNRKVVAIGEVGLDYYWLRKKDLSREEFFKETEKQKEMLRRQLGLAVQMDLPVIIHNRKASEDMLTEIERYRETKRLRGVFHCFTETADLADRILDSGFLISLTAVITYPSSKELRETVKNLPLEKILLETDSPFLAPQTQRGQRNEPAFITETAKTVASLKNLTLEEILRLTGANAERLFKLS